MTAKATPPRGLILLRRREMCLSLASGCLTACESSSRLCCLRLVFSRRSELRWDLLGLAGVGSRRSGALGCKNEGVLGVNGWS